MAKRITKDDIIAPGILDEAIKASKDLNIVLDTLIKTQKELFDQSKKTAQAIELDKNIAEGIKKLEAALKKLEVEKKNLNLLEKDQIQAKKELVNLEIAEQRALQAKTRTTIQARKEEERQIKIATRLANEKKKLTSIYARESARLNTLRKRYKDLALSENGASTATRKLQREIQKLDKRLKQADADVGQFQRSVGDYKQALAGSLGTIGQFATGVGAIAAGVLIAGKVLTSGIDIIKGFEQANANLQAVLGVTRDEMGALIEQAKALGASTSFSASEVTGLQTEFAKLGFPTRDIQLMTASTLDAANAMGSDLGEQAKLTGATLKAFNLDASETQRVNDVLSKATSASALDFQKLQSSMATIAPVANAFGFSLEGTTALLGQLANAGFDASSAATATRNILLNLADTNSKLGKSLKEPVKDLPSLVKGLKQLRSEGIDLGEALELTDKRSVAAFSTFLDGADDVLALNKTLQEAGGTAEQMANVQLDTLEGSLKILNSAWEGFILSIEDSIDSSNAMRFVLGGLINLLSFLSGETKELKKTQSELNDENIKTLELSTKNAKENENLADRYEELTNKVELNGDEKNELNRITTNLIAKFGKSVTFINAETGALEINIQAVRKKILADRILSSEAAKNLIAQKAELEIKIELAAASEKNLDVLKKTFEFDPTKPSSVTIVTLINIRKAIDSAKKGSLEYARSLTDIRNSYIKNNEDATEFENSLETISDELEANSAAVFNLTNNQIELNKINAKFLSQGIDIDKFLDEEVKLNADLGDGLKDVSDKTRILTGLIEKQSAAVNKLQEQKERTGDEAEIASITKEIEVARKELDRLIKLGETAKLKEDGTKEAEFNLAVFRKELAIKEEKDFEQKIQNEINLVTFKANEELKNEELLAAEKKLIEEKLQADINEIARRGDEERNKLREEEKVDIFENSTAIATFLTNLERKANAAKIKAIDDEIKASEIQQQVLAQAAREGVADAKDNLAIAEQQEEEARLRKAQELKKQKREELGLVFLKLVASHAEQGDKNPVLAATTDLIQTQAFIAALAGFYEGTDDVGKSLGSPQMQGKDGHIIRVDGKEQIWSDKNRKEVGYDSRDNIIQNYQLVERMKAGDFEKAHKELTVVNQYQDNTKTLEAFKSLENEVRKNRPPKQQAMFSEYHKAMIETIEQQGRIDKYITQVGGGGIMGSE